MIVIMIGQNLVRMRLQGVQMRRRGVRKDCRRMSRVQVVHIMMMVVSCSSMMGMVMRGSEKVSILEGKPSCGCNGI